MCVCVCILISDQITWCVIRTFSASHSNCMPYLFILRLGTAISFWSILDRFIFILCRKFPFAECINVLGLKTTFTSPPPQDRPAQRRQRLWKRSTIGHRQRHHAWHQCSTVPTQQLTWASHTVEQTPSWHHQLQLEQQQWHLRHQWYSCQPPRLAPPRQQKRMVHHSTTWRAPTHRCCLLPHTPCLTQTPLQWQPSQ